MNKAKALFGHIESIVNMVLCTSEFVEGGVILIVVVVSWVFLDVEIHQRVQLKYVQFFV